MTDNSTKAKSTFALPMVFVVLWSTGFIGARLGLPWSEPMTFLGMRFLFVATVLAALIPFVGTGWPTWRQLWQQSATGFFNHVLYLGGVFYSIELGLEAGLSALIVGLQPIAIALGAGLVLGERLSLMQWTGMALGLAGVALIVIRKLDAGVGDWLSIAPSFIGLIGLSLGSVLQKRWSGTTPMLPGNMVQFAFSGLVCALIALVFETGAITWNTEFTIAMVWSIVVLSFGALTLYYILIRRGAASRVASLFFLVPPVTALFAWFLFDETLGPLELLGMAVAAIGVLIVLRQPTRAA